MVETYFVSAQHTYITELDYLNFAAMVVYILGLLWHIIVSVTSGAFKGVSLTYKFLC